MTADDEDRFRFWPEPEYEGQSLADTYSFVAQPEGENSQFLYCTEQAHDLSERDLRDLMTHEGIHMAEPDWRDQGEPGSYDYGNGQSPGWWGGYCAQHTLPPGM